MTRHAVPHRLLFAGTLAALVSTVACSPTTPATPNAEPSPSPETVASPRPANPPAPSDTASPAAPPTDPANTPATPPPGTSLPEPAKPAAETSAQAAATKVETYFALLGEGKTGDADALWGDAGNAAKFRAEFDRLGKPNVEVDAPGDTEGAAGSVYVTVPVRFQPTAVEGNARERHGEVVLRRVNDVDGSTAAQRRWHIDRIDVAMTPK